EERRGRIAAGICNEPSGMQAISRQLGETVHRLPEQLGRRMGVAVPALVELWIAKPEIAADVDDRAAVVEPSARLFCGFPRRKRREDDLGIADLGSDDERIRRRVQVRLRRAKRLALMRAGHGGHESGLWMP